MKPRALLALAFLFVATPAVAEPFPRRFRLDVAPNTCTNAEALREALAVALRSDPVDPAATDLVAVEVLAGSNLARARWSTGARERTVTVTGGCAALLAELALSIAVAYETDAPPVVACDAACRAQIRAEVRAEICQENPRSCNVDIVPVVLAGGLLSAGLTADPGGGAWLGGEVRFGETFSAAAEARVLFPSRARSTAGDDFAVTLGSLAVVPCVRWSWLLGCVSADIGFLALGVVTTSGEPIVATFGVGPRLAVQIPLGDRFGLRVFADARFAPVPSRVGPFLDTGGRWQTEIASGLFGLALTFQ